MLIGVVFLAGCGQKSENQTQTTPSAFVSENEATNQSPSTSVEKKVATDSSCGSKVKDASGITYGTVLAEDGKCWLDRNLGATRVAISSTDKDAYGWYFQWGRGADGHQLPTSGETTTLSSADTPGHAKFITMPIATTGYGDWRSPQKDNLWQGVDGKNNPCPSGFRLPTSSEWESLVSSAKIKNSDTAFSSALKLTAAVFRGDSGMLFSKGSDGNYWSSNTTSTGAYYLTFDSGNVDPTDANHRAYGLSVRCIKAQNDFTDSTNKTKRNPILDYLPYSTFNYSITTANNDSSKIGLNVDIFLYSADTRDGGKDESIKKYKSEVIDWLKSKKLNPDNYSINYNIK